MGDNNTGMRKYLQFTRAHTAPLETVPAILGASIATGGMLNTNVFLWGIAGLMYHLAGYGQNSYSDWENGYDKDDPYKEHLPLNSGDISPRLAKYLSYGLFIVFVSYVTYLVFPDPLGLSIALIGLVSGVSYNFIGKETVMKFLLISLAHASVFVMAYVDSGGAIDSVIFVSSSLFIIVWVTYQISVSGEVKDIVQDEEKNFLTDAIWMDTRVIQSDEGIIISFGDEAKIYSLSLRVLAVVIGSYIAYESSGTFLIPAIVSVIGLGAAIAGLNLTRDGMFNRNVRLRNMAAIEILTMYMMIVALSPIIGVLQSLTLIIGSVVWVVVFNKYLWGTALAPQV